MTLASQISTSASRDAYHDVNQLQQLAALSNTDSAADTKQAIDEVAKQFESLLVHQMLKSMRSANKIWSEDSLFNTERVGFYQQMLDDQWSIELTSGQGLDIADSIANQYSHLYDEPASQSSNSEQQLGVSKMESLRRYTGEIASGNISSLMSRSAFSANAEAIPVAASNEDVVDKSDDDSYGHSGDPSVFIDRLMPLAKQAASALGVPAEQIVAQAALETGWGKHMLSHDDGRNSHNYFGIKADNRWSGERVQATTTEFLGGKAIRVSASFRSYDSPEAAFSDYVSFLQSSDRYDKAIQSDSDFAAGLQQAGYATDPAYASKIERIASQLVNAGDEG